MSKFSVHVSPQILTKDPRPHPQLYATLHWIHCQSAPAMSTAPEDDIKLTSPEMHGNQSIDGASVRTRYSVINKITACKDSVLTFATKKNSDSVKLPP